ncbi:histidine kinase dimerization/phospho-acceptor domain-containing protein [Acinetobacter baumannii]
MGISHELRTPLNSILGYGSQILQKQKNNSLNKGKMALGVIQPV